MTVSQAQMVHQDKKNLPSLVVIMPLIKRTLTLPVLKLTVLQKVASLWTKIALLSLLTTPLQLLLLQAMLLAGANLMRKLKISNLLVSLLWIHHS